MHLFVLVLAEMNHSTMGINSSLSSEVLGTRGRNGSNKTEPDENLTSPKLVQTSETLTSIFNETIGNKSVEGANVVNFSLPQRSLLEESHSKLEPEVKDSFGKASTVENNERLEEEADSSFDLLRGGEELDDEYRYDYDDYVNETMWGDEGWQEETHEKAEDYVDVDAHILCTPVNVYFCCAIDRCLMTDVNTD